MVFFVASRWYKVSVSNVRLLFSAFSPCQGGVFYYWSFVAKLYSAVVLREWQGLVFRLMRMMCMIRQINGNNANEMCCTCSTTERTL